VSGTCPTPTKSRYATGEAARRAATRVGFTYSIELRAYECACTWFHLTSQPVPQHTLVTADTARIQYVSALPDLHFREIVALDAQNKADPMDAAALRSRINLKRWSTFLGQLLNDIEMQIGERRHRTDLENHDWRKRALGYRTTLMSRKVECQKLRAEAHEQTMRNNDSRLLEAQRAAAAGATVKELRTAAGEVAVDRLIDAHGTEFCRYLAEAYAELGITLPDRVKRHLGGIGPSDEIKISDENKKLKETDSDDDE